MTHQRPQPPQRQRDGKKPPPPPPRPTDELRLLRAQLKELRLDVNKLKDILQIQDNWHARVSKWIDTPVEFNLVNHQPGKWISGILKWTDRYNLCVEVEGNDEVINKGALCRIRSVLG